MAYKPSKQKLRILTNIRLYPLAGIAQYVSGFVAHNESAKDFSMYGVDIVRPDEIPVVAQYRKQFKNFQLLQYSLDYLPLGTINEMSQGDLSVLRHLFKDIIATYAKAIRRVKPDIILINGSYFLPWCLFQAAQEYNKAKIVVHYHGILKKEVAHWTNTIDRKLMVSMEKCFDQKDVFYIFPSNLAKKTVEKEVFGHSIAQYAILPNPVASEFFTKPSRSKKDSIGFVGRWSKIKNTDFLISLAKRNIQTTNPITINVVTDLKSPKDTQPFNKLMRFKKPMGNKELARFYARQGVIISPSTFETYGNVAQEAIATGTPALVNSAMGVAETFHKIGLSGYVIDFTSPTQVLKKAKVVSASRVPKEIVAALREECSSEKIFSKYADLLRTGN